MSNEQSKKPIEIDLRQGFEQELEEALNQLSVQTCEPSTDENAEKTKLPSSFNFDAYFEEELAWILNTQPPHDSSEDPSE